MLLVIQMDNFLAPYRARIEEALFISTSGNLAP